MGLGKNVHRKQRCCWQLSEQLAWICPEIRWGKLVCKQFQRISAIYNGLSIKQLIQPQQERFPVRYKRTSGFAGVCPSEWENLPYADGLAEPKTFNYLRVVPQNQAPPQVVAALSRSLGPIDSKITPQAMDYICHVLTTKESKRDNYRVNNLNFDFCYLDKPLFNQLSKAISCNLSLIRLVLSNNNLGQESINNFLAVLENNLSLIEVNLAANLLEDTFAFALSHTLRKNQILQIVDVSKNNIGPQGGRQILAALTEGNDTLESLGLFETNQRLGSQLVEKIKRGLRINRISREVRSKILLQQPQLSVGQIANRQTEAFLDSEFLQYELLQPLAVTNPLREDPARINIWKFN